MNLETRKLDLIQRLMRVRETAILEQYEKLLTKAQLIARTDESIEAIKNGETISLQDFKLSNKQWLKAQTTK